MHHNAEPSAQAQRGDAPPADFGDVGPATRHGGPSGGRAWVIPGVFATISAVLLTLLIGILVQRKFPIGQLPSAAVARPEQEPEPGSAPSTSVSPAVALAQAFDEAEAARLLRPGANTVRGNAFMRQRGGDVVTCAGSPVTLVPATAYATERMRHIYGNDIGGTAPLTPQSFIPDVEAYQKLNHETLCDSRGDFAFDGVADGAFYVVTQVAWETGGKSTRSQGGLLMKRVVVRSGHATSVVLAP